MFSLLIIFSSFTNPYVYENGDFWQYNQTSYKDFIRQAYDFRTNQNLPIPEFYYDILGIENPKLPDWINTPATEPIKESSYADKIPLWIRRGQLMRESSSYYLSDGSIKYVNKKREIGRASCRERV